ncbi:MAG: AAA family ATPase [Gemmatimonadetes bacterium]|nr:AAA family ATPase [Gemmatimonadota bacterium]
MTDEAVPGPASRPGEKTLVFILGPPAVGKTVVGQAISDRTCLPLFHAHMTLELVLPFFAFGSEPFNRLVREYRMRMFEEIVASELPGVITTGMWALDAPGDRAYVEDLMTLFESAGGRAVFLELWADLDTRLARNRTEPRLSLKPSKRDVEASDARLRAASERYRLNSDGDFPFAPHIKLDNTALEPYEVAERAIRELGLRAHPVI